MLLLLACTDEQVRTATPGAPDTPDTDDSGTSTADTDPVDADGDGVIAGEDCDDQDPDVHPGATETCNGVDDNCDTLVDEGVALTLYADTDHDGYGDAASSATGCAPSEDQAENAEDCDDADAGVHPGAPETCDGVDDDCDGTRDPASPPSCPSVSSASDEGGGLVPIDPDGFVLADEDGWAASTAILDALGLPVVSVGDVLDDGNRDGAWISDLDGATGFARGFTWNSGDDDVDYWYPQGVTGSFDANTTGEVDGHTAVLVAWHYDPENAGTSYDKGARISFADLASDVTYRHVLLVEPTGTASDPDFAAVEVHAGGIAWVGSLLYVADTNNGLRVFDLGRILEVSTDVDDIGCDGGTCYAYQYKYVLPQVTRYAMPACGCDTNFSFVGLDRGSSSLVTGEYDADTVTGRLLRWPIDLDTALLAGGAYTTASEAFVAQQDRVQGAASKDGNWWLSCSSQSGSDGRLYRVREGSSHTYTWVYGPEDLAIDLGNDWLWSATEHVGERAVFAVELGDVGG